MSSNFYLSIVSILLLLFFFGCATTQERLLDSDASQVQLRAIQTRTYDTTDKEKTLRTIMATLQDLSFVIDQADAMLGTVTATKLDRYELRITVSIRQKGQTQTLIRANCQYGNRPVYDPEPYQSFFASLDKAMFLTANIEGDTAGTYEKKPQVEKGIETIKENSLSHQQQPIESIQTNKLESEIQTNEFNQGDLVLLEFKDGSKKVITITAMDEKFIAGYYEYELGGYQIADTWVKDSISAIKHARLSPKTDYSYPKNEQLFKPGDTVLLEFKHGGKREIILTNINDRFVAGHYNYMGGKTTPVNYDIREIKNITLVKKQSVKPLKVDFDLF